MLALAAKGPLWGDLGDQLALDGNSKSKNEDGSDLGRACPQVTSVANSPFSTGGAAQLIPE